MAARRKHLFLLSALACLIPLVVGTGCNQEAARTEFLLGTFCSIHIWGGSEADLDAAFDRIREIEKRASRFIDGSDIKLIYQNQPDSTQVSTDTCKIIKRAIDFGRFSGGLFDITIVPVLDLWGFETDQARIPLPDELETALSMVDYRRIQILDGCRVVTGPGQRIDLGGIAKGYASEEAARVLENAGVARAMINLGGNIFALGKKKGGVPWKIGIQDPLKQTGAMVGVLETPGGAVVTSGIYERFIEVNGKRYHHILDPNTGYPVKNNLAGISISMPSGLDADALSTTVFVLGLEKGCELLRSFPDCGAVFITRGRDIITFGTASSAFKLTNQDYTVTERR